MPATAGTLGMPAAAGRLPRAAQNTYRDIAPRATTLSKLRNGKTRHNKNAGRGSRQVGGSARVLSRKVLNEGLKKLELAEALKVAREKAAAERKLAAEERKQAKQVREQQWRFDLDAYADQVTAWREQVASLEAEWKEHRDQARMDHNRPPKKPELPIRPKRPLKPKGGPIGDLTALEEADVEGDDTEADIPEILRDNAELIEDMRNLELDGFADML